MRLSHLLSVFLFISAPVIAAEDFPPPSKDLAKIPSGPYKLDKSHASIVFKINHLGFSEYTARFDNFDATLDFDAKDPTKSKLQATIYPGSLNANDKVLEEKLEAPDFFNVAKFTTATFESTKIEKLSNDRGAVTGNFTLLGVTKPVILYVTFNGGGVNPFSKTDVLGFSAVGKFKRSDFGMSNYIPSVGDEVTLFIEAEFTKPKAQ